MFVYCSYNVNKKFTMFVDFMTENDKKIQPYKDWIQLNKKGNF